MVGVFAFLVIAVVLVIGLLVAVSVFMAVVLLVIRLAGAILLAMAGGGIAAAIAAIWIEDAWPLIFASVSLLLLIPAIGWMFRARSPKSNLAPADAIPKTIRPLEPAGDTELIAAWKQAEALAPGYALRLMAARETCAQLLNRSDASLLDMDLIEGAQMVRKHVPDVIAQNAEAIVDSAGDDLEAARLALVEDLETIARIAQNRLVRRKEANRDRLTALRAHLSSRSTE